MCFHQQWLAGRQESILVAVVLDEELTAAASSTLLQCQAGWALALGETAFLLFLSGHISATDPWVPWTLAGITASVGP